MSAPCPSCGSSAPCIMCHGSGAFPYRTPEIEWHRCGACWGTGIDHTDLTQNRTGIVANVEPQEAAL